MKQIQKNDFISYVLSDQVWWCNTKFYKFYKFSELILKIASTKSCKPIYDILNYSTTICPFESEKCGKEWKKLQKREYLENEKSFLDEIKYIFHSFWRPIRNFNPQALTLKEPFISESCIEIKIELNLYFHISLWCFIRFYESL